MNSDRTTPHADERRHSPLAPLAKWAGWLLIPGAWLIGAAAGVWLVLALRRAERLYLRYENEALHAIEAFAGERITLAHLDLAHARFELACARRAVWRARAQLAGIPAAVSPSPLAPSPSKTTWPASGSGRIQ